MQAALLVISIIILITGAVMQQEKSVPTEMPSPTVSPTITTTPTPIQSGQAATDLEYFRYPGSSGSTTNMTSTDDADKITNWYKEKIKSEGFKSTAFAVTKTNGNILTKLAGSKQNVKIQVEITKGANDASTKISISLDTY